MTRQHAIVQVEFFLVSHFLQKDDPEVMGRLMDGGKVKETLRFYDRDGGASSFARAAHQLAEEIRFLERQFPRKKGWKRFLLSRRLKQAYQKRDPRAVAIFMRDRVKETIRRREPIFIENPDRSFRPLQDNERHELVETVSASTHAWVFIMAPAPLAAESQKVSYCVF